MSAPRFTVFAPPHCLTPQLRDNCPHKPGAIPPPWIVAQFPTLGGGMTTGQGRAQAVRLARKIARLLNERA